MICGGASNQTGAYDRHLDVSWQFRVRVIANGSFSNGLPAASHIGVRETG
jgi:hypothetical protein